jgi:predicted nuclease with TOPRIM domain
MKVDISTGEFLDKLTILQIKAERIADTEKLKSINKELTLLQDTWQKSAYHSVNLTEEIAELKKVNETLWEIEDNIRDKERHKVFDQGFIDLARAVYINNDKRAEIKRAINLKTGSELIEEKSYAAY